MLSGYFGRQVFAALVARFDGERQRPLGVSDVGTVAMVHVA
jgi:hypothetical protein